MSSRMSSGRIPNVTVPAAGAVTGLPPASLTRAPSARNAALPFSSTSRPLRKFIGGVPMKPATKRLTGARYNSIGRPTCCMRPSARTTMRSPSVIASTWSCVTYTVVVLRRRCRLPISIRICARRPASRLDRGSSNRKTSGSRTIARPIATRWRCPPDSCLGLRSSRGSRPSIPPAHATRFSISSRGNFRSLRPSERFSRTVM